MNRRTGKSLLLAMFTAGFGMAAAPFQPEGPPPAPECGEGGRELSRGPQGHRRGRPAPGTSRARPSPETVAGWRTFFDALKGELATYSAATGSEREIHLARPVAPDGSWPSSAINWAPVVPIRSALDEWLTPRVRIAWAERRLFDYVEAHRGDSSGSTEHTMAWKKFVDDDLGSALAGYESAKTVQARRAALKRLTGVLASLRKNNQAVSWPYSHGAPGGPRRSL